MNKKGVSLIELVISMAILGMIVVTILSIFNTGLTNIVRAGDITEITNSAGSEIDKKILTAVVGDEKVSEAEININIPGLPSIPIKGKLIVQESVDTKGNSVTISTFIPK